MAERKPRAHQHVYFIQAEQLGLVKIGWAVDAADRIKCFQTGSPDRLTLRGVLYADDARKLEGILHRHFAEERVHGEWFRASPRILDYIEQCLWPVQDKAPCLWVLTPQPPVEPDEPVLSIKTRAGESMRALMRRVTEECERLGIPA